MKKFRVLMVALLSLVLCGGVFAGCGGDKEKTLKVAVFEGGYGVAHWDKIVKGFEAANEGVTVELIKSSTLESEIRPTYLAGNGPDVVYLATNRKEGMTEQMLTDKYVHKLNGLLEQNVYGENVKLKDRMVSKIMGSTATNPYVDAKNDTYMLPLHISGNGLFYNANLFYTGDTAVEGKYPLPQSWEDFNALGDQLNTANAADEDNANDRYLFTYPNSDYMDSMLPSTIASAAGVDKLNQLFNYDPLWADAGVAKAMDKIAGLKDYIHPNTMANAYLDNQKLVVDGKALFMPNGDWVISEMAGYTTAEKNMKWGMIPFIGFEDAQGKVGERYSYTNIEQIWISKTAEAKGVMDLAEKFLLYVYSSEALNMFAEFGNNAIVAASNYATIAKGANSKVDAEVLARNEALIDGTAAPLSGNFATPSKGVGSVNWKATLYQSIDQVMSGEKSKEDWIAKIISDAALLKAAL